MIFDVVLGRTEALVAAGSSFLLILGIAALPSILLRERKHPLGSPDAG